MEKVTRARLLAALVLAAGLPADVVAQGTAASPPSGQELGIDAGATFGFGTHSSVQLTLPAARARVGFFMTNDTRWSLEPAAFLSYTKVKDVAGKFIYDLQLGALYHFRPPADVYDLTRASVAYVRPFVGIDGSSGGGSNNELSAGAGLGVKIPWRPDLAWRLEANAGYGFRNDALRLGAFAGLSFFTPGTAPGAGR